MRRRRPKTRIVYNPARDEYVDSLTGAQVTPLATGATATGRRFIRLRPAPGAPLQAVIVESADIDERRASYALDRKTRARYVKEAGKEARARRKLRKGSPIEADDDLVLQKMGIPTTFGGARQGAGEFMSNNAAVFEAPAMADPDVSDVTRDFMDRLEVRRRGGRHVPLSKTARGREILAGGKGGGRMIAGGQLTARSGGTVVTEMLVYLFGKAGKYRRYADVPWDAVEDYVSLVWNTAHGGGAAQADEGAPIEWWPMASGHYSDEKLLPYAVEQVGAQKAQKIADHHTSKKLHGMADALERIVSPPKGPSGKFARSQLKCIPTGDRKLIRHRARVLRDWARFPDQIPEWACVPKAWGSFEIYACEFPALERDVRMITEACETPYDPEWPNKLRRDYWEEGKTSEMELHGSGLMPLEFDPAAEPTFAVAGRGPVREKPESLDLPWERVANARGINPAVLKRRLTRR